jgi:hypothetical protein
VAVIDELESRPGRRALPSSRKRVTLE